MFEKKKTLIVVYKDELLRLDTFYHNGVIVWQKY